VLCASIGAARLGPVRSENVLALGLGRGVGPEKTLTPLAQIAQAPARLLAALAGRGLAFALRRGAAPERIQKSSPRLRLGHGRGERRCSARCARLGHRNP